jgi:hypothetical protein
MAIHFCGGALIAGSIMAWKSRWAKSRLGERVSLLRDVKRGDVEKSLGEVSERT